MELDFGEFWQNRTENENREWCGTSMQNYSAGKGYVDASTVDAQTAQEICKVRTPSWNSQANAAKRHLPGLMHALLLCPGLPTYCYPDNSFLVHLITEAYGSLPGLRFLSCCSWSQKLVEAT